MHPISETAYAKLNLTLDILGKREDGYHDLRMVMQSVSLCDRLAIAPGEGVRVRTNLYFLPTGDRNLAAIAAQRFYETLGRPAPGMEITIQKSIPVCAGMAGGSSDGAAVLRALNRMEGTPFSETELMQIGARVGSDVPYCVMGGTALAEGRGEVLTRLKSLPDCWIVVCKPPFSISTPELFGRIDSIRLAHHPDTAGMLGALERGDLNDIARRLYNVFEDALTKSQLATVAEIKNILIDCGALGAAMSGSGPSTFGIFSDETSACNAVELLSGRYEDTFLTRPV